MGLLQKGFKEIMGKILDSKRNCYILFDQVTHHEKAFSRLVDYFLESDDALDGLIEKIHQEKIKFQKAKEKDDKLVKLILPFLKSSKTFGKLLVQISENKMSSAKLASLKDLLQKFFGRISYSQCGEDLIVNFIFESLKIKQPSYLDIGAYDPYELSNTAYFYLKGSRGVNIEPNPENFEKFEEARKEDVNLNIGISGQSGELTYYFMDASALNTFSAEEAERYDKEQGHQIIKKKPVKVDTIENVLKKHCKNKFPDFLSLDAEGIDEILLKSIDFQKNYPKVICVETISYSNKIGEGKTNQKLINYLTNRGYILYASTHINSIFVNKKLLKTNNE